MRLLCTKPRLEDTVKTSSVIHRPFELLKVDLGVAENHLGREEAHALSHLAQVPTLGA
jgi:hypothetical protein